MFYVHPPTRQTYFSLSPCSAKPYLSLSPFFHLVVICTLCCQAEGRPETLEKCGRRFAPLAETRIVGGEWAMPGEYPWMVSLQEKNDTTGELEHICGGTIINEHFIITAAHCVFFSRDASRYAIYVGLNRLSKKSKKPARKYLISKVIVHEKYPVDLMNGAFDIALLRTAEPIDFDRALGYVNGICLPETDRDPTGWAIVTGWGDTTYEGSISDALLEVKIPIVPRKLCVETYRNAGNDSSEIQDIEICAGLTRRDSCQGDSGGPLVQKDKRGTFTLIGIVSYGIGCGNRTYPGVYQKVASYMDWIEENMKDTVPSFFEWLGQQFMGDGNDHTESHTECPNEHHTESPTENLTESSTENLTENLTESSTECSCDRAHGN